MELFSVLLLLEVKMNWDKRLSHYVVSRDLTAFRQLIQKKMPSLNNLELRSHGLMTFTDACATSSNINDIMSITPPHFKYSYLFQVIQFFYSIATYDTQSIDITSTSGEVCVVCRFSINTTAVGCEIQILQNNIMTLRAVRFDRDVNNIAEGCISNIITGYYDLYVYDVENDNTLSQLPAIIKNQVFVDEQRTTTTEISTTATGLLATTVLASSISLTSSSSFPSRSKWICVFSFI